MKINIHYGMNRCILNLKQKYLTDLHRTTGIKFPLVILSVFNFQNISQNIL